MLPVSQGIILAVTADAAWAALAAILCLLVGLGLIGLGYYFFVKGQKHWRRLSARATGTVVRLVESERIQTAPNGVRETIIEVTPTVAFVTLGGEKMRFTASSTSSRSAYKVKQKVTVIYDPEQPEDAYTRSSLFSELWLAPIVLWFLGLVFSTIACLLVFFVTQ